MENWWTNQATHSPTLKDGEFYLWYSSKMATVIGKNANKANGEYRTFYKTKDGEVEVTVVTKVPNSGCKGYDDMLFRGVGTFSRAEKL